ncbi:DNA translocase FtsK [Phenylobacterium sp.]|uniref:DNA translocase FtsK n=1 Tax=Phenylobacterium sp. TaxID=1871053 RepID=UPI002F3FBBDE
MTAQDVIDVAHTLYREAVALVLENRNASTSFVQRKLQLPHKTALVLMDLMEAQGVVSPADFKGKRQVLALAP